MQEIYLYKKTQQWLNEGNQSRTYPSISHSLISHTVYNYTGQGLVHT